MQLTQKESQFIKELKGQEKVCIEKFTRYSQMAKDTQLKNLFTQLAQAEQGHLNTLTDIESGKQPQAGGGSSTAPTFTETYSQADSEDKKHDCFLCSDSLGTEKHVSSLYNTSVFEFANPQLRDTLNGIQKAEQGHGKMIYDYMSANNMYS